MGFRGERSERPHLSCLRRKPMGMGSRGHPWQALLACYPGARPRGVTSLRSSSHKRRACTGVPLPSQGRLQELPPLGAILGQIGPGVGGRLRGAPGWP